MEARQHTQSEHQAWKGGGGRVCRGEGGRGGTAPTLGLEVITVLCTQNNWSHQCGCHMESLALPRHRCSPYSGQNPPIKPKLVAKRPLTPPPLSSSPWVSTNLQHLHSSKGSSQFEGKQKTRSVLRIQLSSDAIILCSHVWKRLDLHICS